MENELLKGKRRNKDISEEATAVHRVRDDDQDDGSSRSKKRPGP